MSILGLSPSSLVLPIFQCSLNPQLSSFHLCALYIPKKGSSSSISTQTNLAPTPAANKGKQPLLPGSETSPIVISSPSSSEAVLVEHPEPKSVAKKMRLMREKGWEDWIQLKSKTAPSGELKLGCDADEKVTEGFLYRYYTGEISIVCSCHGVFLTPAEFVAHAAGDDADKLMKHIFITSSPIPF